MPVEQLLSWLLKALIITAQLFLVYIGIKLLVVSKPVLNLFKKGWSSLRERHEVAAAPAGMQSTSAIIGAVSYRNTINIKLTDDGLYLEKSFLGRSCVFVPYNSIFVVAPPKREKIVFFHVQTNGVFAANGVEISLSVEYSKLLIEKLSGPGPR